MLRNDVFLTFFFITTLSRIIYNTPKEHTPKLQKKRKTRLGTQLLTPIRRKLQDKLDEQNKQQRKEKRKENNNNNNKITIKSLIKKIKKKTPRPSDENTLKIVCKGDKCILKN